MTTPPTAAQVDTYMTSQHFDYMFGTDRGSLFGTTDRVLRVVAYTDNSSVKHYEGIGLGVTGAAGASDSDIGNSSPAIQNGGGPFYASGLSDIDGGFESLPYLRYLIDSYGTIRLRGYLLPAFIWPPAAVSSTAESFASDPSNWPTAA